MLLYFRNDSKCFVITLWDNNSVVKREKKQKTKLDKIIKIWYDIIILKEENKIRGVIFMKLLKLLNHELTETQSNELKNNWNVTEIVTLSNENIKRFGHVTK